MDINQLRCFVVVGDELNFGRAARKLEMNQKLRAFPGQGDVSGRTIQQAYTQILFQ
jgi:hypothetical protein